MRTIFVGDVHGCLDELRSLITALDLQADDRLVFTGDLVDKGPNSLGVLRYVRGLVGLYPGSVVVSGNHEEKASRQHKRGIAVEPWVNEATADDWAFIDAMPLTWADHALNVRVVHGGIAPTLIQKHPDVWEKVAAATNWRKGGGKALDRARRMLRVRYVGGPQRPEPGDMLSLGADEVGDPFWTETWTGSTTVVYGHSPWLDGEVRFQNLTVGVDTGCVFGVKLSAYVLVHGRPSDEHYVVSVPALRRYAEPLDEGED